MTLDSRHTAGGFKLVCFFMLTWLLFVVAHRQREECVARHPSGAYLVTTVTLKRPLRHQQKRGEPSRFRDNDSSPTKNFGNRGASTLFPIQGAKQQQTEACKAHAP